MRRLVIDTNIYIDWFNAGRHEEILFARETIKHLSAVVLMELCAGAFDVRDRRLVQRVESAFAKAGRILLPSRVVFVEAGDVLRRLQVKRDFQLEASHSIVNDVLIALSARSIGATVVTQNERHYRANRSGPSSFWWSSNTAKRNLPGNVSQRLFVGSAEVPCRVPCHRPRIVNWSPKTDGLRRNGSSPDGPERATRLEPSTLGCPAKALSISSLSRITDSLRKTASWRARQDSNLRPPA